METQKEVLIRKVVALEAEMFVCVRSSLEAPCQQDLEAFSLHREAQVYPWSEKTLKSYLSDLLSAKQQGINLMTIKYARMGEQIPPYSCNPLIPELVEQFLSWQIETKKIFPNLMQGSRTIEDFCNYLASELETYSDQTLSLLNLDVAFFLVGGKNMTVSTYERMAHGYGFSSLHAMEEYLSRR
jgi:hypothetical protein